MTWDMNQWDGWLGILLLRHLADIYGAGGMQMLKTQIENPQTGFYQPEDIDLFEILKGVK